MDIEKIKAVVNSSMPDSLQRQMIIRIIADDNQAIPDILDLLANERKNSKKLIQEYNLYLSKAHLGLINATYKKGELNSDHFIDKEIEAFFHKFKNYKDVGHLFKKLEDLRPGEEKEGFYND